MSLRETVPCSLGAESTRGIQTYLIIQITLREQCKKPFCFTLFQSSSKLEITAVLPASCHTQARRRAADLCLPAASPLGGINSRSHLRRGLEHFEESKGTFRQNSHPRVNDSTLINGKVGGIRRLVDGWITYTDHKGSTEPPRLPDTRKWCREHELTSAIFASPLPQLLWDDNTESHPLLYFKPCDICVFFLVAQYMEDEMCMNKNLGSRVPKTQLNTTAPCLLEESLRRGGLRPYSAPTLLCTRPRHLKAPTDGGR